MTSWCTSEVKPHHTDASVKIAVPMRKTSLRPYRSPSEPPTSINAARNSVYALTTHCMSIAVACSSACTTGNAMLTTVPSMNTMLEPRIVAARTNMPVARGQGVGAAVEPAMTPASHG